MGTVERLAKYALQVGWLDLHRSVSLLITVFVVLNCGKRLRRREKTPQPPPPPTVTPPATTPKKSDSKSPVAQTPSASASGSTGSLDSHEKPKSPKKSEENAEVKEPVNLKKKKSEDKKPVEKEKKKSETKEEENDAAGDKTTGAAQENEEHHEVTFRLEMSDDDHTRTKTVDYSSMDMAGSKEGVVEDVTKDGATKPPEPANVSTYVGAEVVKLNKKPSKFRTKTVESPEKAAPAKKEKKAVGATSKRKKDGTKTQESVEC